MAREDRRATIAYLVLIAATAASFWAAEHVANRILAVAAIMAIAAFKVLTVLRRFMELDHAALAFRAYFRVWAIGAGAMTFGAAWLGTR